MILVSSCVIAIGGIGLVIVYISVLGMSSFIVRISLVYALCRLEMIWNLLLIVAGIIAIES